jgi:4-oxalocrotonate tautomerase
MTVMPLVEVTLVEGRTPDQLRTLISRLTAAVVDAVGAPKENVRVVLREVPVTHWAAGDVTIEERRASIEERRGAGDERAREPAGRAGSDEG